MGHAMLLNVLHQVRQLHAIHDHLRRAEPHQTECDNACRMGHRCHAQVYRRLSGFWPDVYRECCDHRLKNTVGPDDALGLPGGPT